MNLKGSGCRLGLMAALVVTVVGCSREVTFSPDGSQVAFSWAIAGGQPHILVAGTEGSQLDVVPGSAYGFSPRWAPNGSRLLYAALIPAGGDTRMEGRLYNFGSQTVSKVADGLGPPFAWREDSKRCAGILRRGAALEAYLYNIQDMGLFIDVPLPCKNVSLDNSDMVWVPDTDDLAIVGDSNVYLTEVNQLHTLTTTGDVVGIGRGPGLLSLNYARWVQQGSAPTLALYNYDLHTATATPLQTPNWLHDPALKLPGAVDRVLHVAFSPDGQKLAVRLRFNPTGKTIGPPFEAIYVVGLDGSGPHLAQRSATPPHVAATMSQVVVDTLTASWSQDSKQFAVQENGASNSIRRYNAEGASIGPLLLP